MNNKYIISLIISSIVVVIPLLIGFTLPFTKPTIKKKSYIYLYSLSSGFILVLGLFGLIGQPILEYMEHYPAGNEVQKIGTAIGIATGGTAIGMGSAFLIRHLLHNNEKELHNDHKDHNHGDYIFNVKETQNGKSKLTAIILLSLHKIPAGITLGIFASKTTEHGMEWAAIAAIVLHMIPEMLTIYYRQKEIGVNKWKAIFNTVMVQFIMIPMIFIGTAFDIDSVKWVTPFILSIAGALLVFTAIVELIPEFLDSNLSHGKWHYTMILFVIGFILALAILLIHSH